MNKGDKMDKKNNPGKQQYKGRYGKRNNKKRGKETEINVSDSSINREDLKDLIDKENDPTWYAHSPQLMKDAGSFPFGRPTGSQFNIINNNFSSVDATTVKDFSIPRSIPGIMSINWIPSIGKAQEASDPINTTARNIYSYVRHANSGHSNYEAPDLMMYLLAMDSAYSYYASMVRVYGILSYYSYTNRYIPESILEALGVRDTIVKEIANLRSFINLYATKIASLCVPSGMTYVQRHLWMNLNLFTDSETNKAQIYLYKQAGFYQYRFSTPSQGGLEYVPAPSNASLSTLLSYGELLINAILSVEDFNIMSGDILKAFGENGIFKVAAIDENYQTAFTYSKEVLSQIQNATLVGEVEPEIITQATGIGEGYLTQQLVFSDLAAHDYVNAIVSGTDRIITMYKDNPEPSDVFVATRLTTIPDPSGVEITNSSFIPGSEIATVAQIYYYGINPEDASENFALQTMQFTYAYDMTATQSEAGNLVLGKTQMLTYLLDCFDYHPPVWLITGNVDEAYKSTTNKYISYMCDVDNYTIMAQKDLAQLNEVAILSEFAVPQMGAFDRKI